MLSYRPDKKKVYILLREGANSLGGWICTAAGTAALQEKGGHDHSIKFPALHHLPSKTPSTLDADRRLLGTACSGQNRTALLTASSISPKEAK
jgi:hypothetical protein